MSLELTAVPLTNLPAVGIKPRTIPITVAAGDGIGPEILAATLVILAAAGAPIDMEFVEVGENVYRQGITSGIPKETWDSIERTRVMLKAPITTPQGGGYKSLNVTLRKTLGLFANVRPCRTYSPVVATRHPRMDVVIVRENEEDLYAGIEHRQTQDVTQCLKLITRKGSERIVRYAFEYARKHNRRKVTCMIKDNIMKLTDGLFHRVFDEISEEYPGIEANSQIVDFGMANFVHQPNQYDVVVLPNLYGDILSDIAAQMTGSVGLGGSVNIGAHSAIFEAIHGSAPDLPRDVANPSGLLLAGIEMLKHIGYHRAATRATNAWLKTLEDGIHTADIAGEQTVVEVGTMRFTEAVLERMGQLPQIFTPAEDTNENAEIAIGHAPDLARERIIVPQTKTIVGVDVFVDWRGDDPAELAQILTAATPESVLGLRMVTSRGVKVWPEGHSDTLLTDHWRCRFESRDAIRISNERIADLLRDLATANVDFIKTEHLYCFDGEPGYALGQGQ
jgi:isocitrate dehydrogenase